MPGVETVRLVSILSGDIEQRIEMTVDVRGVCEITLTFVAGDRVAGFSLPCSLNNLLTVAKGLSYQSSSAEGHVRLEWIGQSLQLQMKRASEDRYWNFAIDKDAYRSATEQLDRLVRGRKPEVYLG